jgi:DNA repair exonuclease SbcCD ATPase subunit
MIDQFACPQLTESPLRGHSRDFGNYTRPNYSDILSPIQSDQYSLEIYEKERKARKRMRRLINEQTEINDTMAEENDLLSKQQESLLQLLSNKDRQLHSLAASLNSSSISSLKQKISGSSKAAQTYRLDNVRSAFVGLIRRAWRIVISVARMHAWEKTQLKSSKDPSVPTQMVRCETSVSSTGLPYVRDWGVATNSSLQKSSSAKARHLSTIITHLNQPITTVLARWSQAASKCKLQLFGADCKEALKKAAQLSNRFLRLSALKWTARSVTSRQLQCAFKGWRKETRTRKVHTQALRALARVTKAALKHALDEVLTKPRSLLICLVLSRLMTRRLLTKAMRSIEDSSAIQRWKQLQAEDNELSLKMKESQEHMRQLTVQSEDLKDEISAAKVRLSKIESSSDSPVSRLSNDLEEKRQACAGLAAKVESHLMELKNYKDKTEAERESLEKDCWSLKEASMELKAKLQTAESEQGWLMQQLAQAEDERRLNKVQLTHFQSTVKKLQQQVEANVKEQEQTAAQETECRRQLIKLTTQIDSLATDKELILGEVEALSTELGKLKERLVKSMDEGHRLSEEAFEAQTKV